MESEDNYLPLKSSIKKRWCIEDCNPHVHPSSRSTQTFSDTTTTPDSFSVRVVAFSVVDVRLYEHGSPPEEERDHTDLGPVCIDDFEADQRKSRRQLKEVVEKDVERSKLTKTSPFASIRTHKDIERAKMVKEANKCWKQEITGQKQGNKKKTFLRRWFSQRYLKSDKEHSTSENHACSKIVL